MTPRILLSFSTPYRKASGLSKASDVSSRSASTVANGRRTCSKVVFIFSVRDGQHTGHVDKKVAALLTWHHDASDKFLFVLVAIFNSFLHALLLLFDQKLRGFPFFLLADILLRRSRILPNFFSLRVFQG